LSSSAARASSCFAICLCVTLVGPAAQSPAPGQTAAQPAAAEQPAVKPNAFRTLPAVPLYSGPAPLRADWPGKLAGDIKEVASQNGEVLYNVVDPSYTAFLPEAGRNTGTAVLVAPGGGFRQLSINSEGNRVAVWLAERGVAAFVLKYRLVQQEGPQYSMMARMQEIPINVSGEPAVADTVKAIAMIRQRAAEYSIDPSKVVAIGFSAGAHAVAHAALSTDVAARPNYVAPIYGGPFGGIPPIPAPDAADKLPPIFLAMAQDDKLVGREVREFYAQLFAKGYLPELHLYMSGNHGFGMNVTNNTSDLFIDQFFAWMEAQGLTRKPGDPDRRPRGRGMGPGRGRGGVYVSLPPILPVRKLPSSTIPSANQRLPSSSWSRRA
jgi:acetyl esterase/lipase